MNEYEEAKRDLIEAVINRYHQTRVIDDAVEFILRGPQVQEEFKKLINLYITG